MTVQPPDFAQSPFAKQVHTDPNPVQAVGLDQNTVGTMRGKLVESIVQIVVQAVAGIFLPGPLGSAFTQLTSWATGLPNTILTPLVTLLVTVLDSIPIIGPPIGNAITDLASLLGLMNTNTTTAQSTANTAQDSANTANTGVAQLVAQLDAGTSGALISDSFNRAAASTLGANWDQSYDSGSGTLGTDGSGNMHWTTAGTGSRTCIARYQATTLVTDIQKAQIVFNAALANFFVDPQGSLCLRMNTAKDTYVQALISHSSCEIGYVISGSYTRIGSPTSITSASGDLWEFRAGTAVSNYEFVLLQNGVTKVDVTDTGPSSMLGALYRYSGMVIKAGAKVIGGGSVQEAPPDGAVFTATDYTP